MQHIFDENAISGGRGIHKDVEHGAHHFVVLDDGAVAHADDKRRTINFVFLAQF